MARRRLVIVLAALLTVAALGFTATAIDDGPGGDGATGGTEADTTGSSTGEDTSADESVALVLAVLLVTLAVGSIAYAAYRDSMPRWLVAVLLAAAVILLALIAVGHYIDPPPSDERTGESTPEPSDPPDATTPDSSQGTGETGSSGPLSTVQTLAVLLALLAGGAVVVAQFSTSNKGESEDDAETDESAAVGEAAGRAADELEETTLSNAIFRAWREMTDAVDVDDPETTTPAAFEDAAVDAGLVREDVATLTTLFREVRYGDAPASPEREQRARETLRRIEETYAQQDESDGGIDTAETGGDRQ